MPVLEINMSLIMKSFRRKLQSNKQPIPAWLVLCDPWINIDSLSWNFFPRLRYIACDLAISLSSRGISIYLLAKCTWKTQVIIHLCMRLSIAVTTLLQRRRSSRYLRNQKIYYLLYVDITHVYVFIFIAVFPISTLVIYYDLHITLDKYNQFKTYII